LRRVDSDLRTWITSEKTKRQHLLTTDENKVKVILLLLCLCEWCVLTEEKSFILYTM